jgi:hypothetical protein
MARQRLSQRTKGAEPDGPFDGVPPHLQHALVHWFESVADAGSGGSFAHEVQLRQLAALLRVGVNPGANAATLGKSLIQAALGNQEFFLDLVDGALQIFRVADLARKSLAQLLDISGSVWTVADNGRGLESVVSEESQATYEAATSVADDITSEMREAWLNAFGRNGDPSDAWDHAIKAVENVLIPEMMPNNGNATLGSVVGELAGQNGTQWKMVLPGNNQDHNVAHLVAMLRLMWPNHDRHGGSSPTRTPSAQEARAVVALAATIVQWHREGWVVQKR